MNTVPTLWQLALDVTALCVFGISAGMYGLADARRTEMSKRFAADFPDDPTSRARFWRRQRRLKRIKTQLAELPEWYQQAHRHVRRSLQICWFTTCVLFGLLAVRELWFS